MQRELAMLRFVPSPKWDFTTAGMKDDGCASERERNHVCRGTLPFQAPSTKARIETCLLAPSYRRLDHVSDVAFADPALIPPIQPEVELGMVLDGSALSHLRLHLFVAEEDGEIFLDQPSR